MPSISIIEHDGSRESKNIEINWFGSSPKCGFITSGSPQEETQTRRTSSAPPLVNGVCVYIFRDKFWPRDLKNRHSKNLELFIFYEKSNESEQILYTHIIMCIYIKLSIMLYICII